MFGSKTAERDRIERAPVGALRFSASRAGCASHREFEFDDEPQRRVGGGEPGDMVAIQPGPHRSFTREF